MEINPSEINMETANLSPTEWLEKFIIISKEELELSKKSSGDRAIVSIKNHDDGDEDDDDDEDFEDNDDSYDDEDDDDDDDDENFEDNDDSYDDDDDNNYNDDDNHYNDEDDDDDEDDDELEDRKKNYDENEKKLKAQRDLRMIRLDPLFASQPRLEKICKDSKNRFFNSCFTSYSFESNENDSVNELHEKANDLEYLINLCGINLTYLDVTHYPISQMMPIINANCPNLEELYLGFKEIMSQDFENCFSNMSHLKDLTIEWQCENSTLPMTLAKSLEQVGGTLEILYLSCTLKGNDIFSPDALVSVFPRLIALNCLDINDFGLSQLLLQSIGEIKNLADLNLMSCWPKNHPMYDTRINMYPLGNLKNLEKLHIKCDSGVKDEFLINLCNNAKKLTYLSIPGTNITDIGMSAIDNLEQLKDFNIGLSYDGPRPKKNEFITDESIQCLFNQKLIFLDISNCIKITDKSVIKLVENLPSLRILSIQNTKVTREAVRKIYKLSKHRKIPLRVND